MNDAAVVSKQQFIDYLHSCAKSKDKLKIGIEYEQFVFDKKSGLSLDYAGRPGLKELLTCMQGFGWVPEFHDGILMRLRNYLSVISLEPGGQVELSSTPHENVHQVYDEITTYSNQLQIISHELGFANLTLGFHPHWHFDEIHRMPDPTNRYEIIAQYMNQHGSSGVNMMYRTSSVQVSLDYENESDMIKKLRVSLSMQPILTAIFSNSPFVDGVRSPYLSARSHAWLHANPGRTGMFHLAFNKEFNFETYVDYLMNMPLYLIYRDGKFMDAKSQLFKDFLSGRLNVRLGERPTQADWMNHIGTLWHEVRLKNILELRGVDSGPPARACTITAICTGILYDSVAIDAAWDIFSEWDNALRDRLRSDVVRLGLKTRVNAQSVVLDIARALLDIAYEGLQRRAMDNHLGVNETYYLDEAYAILADGKSPAMHLLSTYQPEATNQYNKALLQVSSLR